MRKTTVVSDRAYPKEECEIHGEAGKVIIRQGYSTVRWGRRSSPSSRGASLYLQQKTVFLWSCPPMARTLPSHTSICGLTIPLPPEVLAHEVHAES